MSDSATPRAEESLITPLPSTKLPLSLSTSHVVLPTEEAVTGLFEALLSRSGLTSGDVARRLGVGKETIRQYVKGKRTNPSLRWFAQVAATCGATLVLEWPAKAR